MSTSRTPSLPVRAAVKTVELPLLVDKHALAEYFGVPVRTVEDWRYRKVIPAPIKVGGTIRWRAEDILRHIEDQAVA